MPLSKKLQEIVDAISSQRQKLLDSLNGMSASQFGYKSGHGAWSISDVLHHLALTDEANAKFTSRILRQAASLAPDPTAESSVLHCMDDVFARLTPEKFQAPDFVTPHENVPPQQSLERLAASRKRMLENLDQLSAYDLSSVTHPHPFAGDLNAYQWFLLAGGHEARHTAQIKRIKAEPGFPE
jgi:hypothetical protein